MVAIPHVFQFRSHWEDDSWAKTWRRYQSHPERPLMVEVFWHACLPYKVIIGLKGEPGHGNPSDKPGDVLPSSLKKELAAQSGESGQEANFSCPLFQGWGQLESWLAQHYILPRWSCIQLLSSRNKLSDLVKARPLQRRTQMMGSLIDRLNLCRACIAVFIISLCPSCFYHFLHRFWSCREPNLWQHWINVIIITSCNMN